MLFNEIIETQSINDIALKTNISLINLGYLIEEDFSKLNRVKALGFLLILEREYKEIDISVLRDKIKTYYDENRPLDEKVVMVAKDSVESDGFSFFKFFIILLLLGGAYYLYSEGKLNSLIQNIEEKKESFTDEKALENNISNKNADKVFVKKSEIEAISIETTLPLKVKTIISNSEILDINISKNQKIIELDLPLDKASLDEVNNSIKLDVKEISNISITTVTVNPTRGMLWFGFINLDSKKRIEFKEKVSTLFNIDNSKWLLVTGHGYLDVFTDTETLKLSDNKKHYFYIDSTEIKEIEKKKFRELNGRRGW